MWFCGWAEIVEVKWWSARRFLGSSSANFDAFSTFLMELIRLAAFVMNSEAAACHSEVLPALKEHYYAY